MPREPRSIQPGAVYHLISRFVDREWFIRKPEERGHYLKLLGRALEHSQWRLISYALMSNHIHLAAIAGEDPLDHWIRRVHAPFADAMNRSYDRIGSMFVRGPKAFLVDTVEVGDLVAYIHNNPVRAGVVAHPADSTWTSHRAYTERGACPPWLHVRVGLDLIGLDAQDFDTWITDPARETPERKFSEAGHERELESMKARAHAAAAQLAPIQAIVRTTAQLVKVTPAQVCSRSRFDAAVLGRTVAVHCALSYGLTGAEVARTLNVSQQAVSVIQRRAVDDRARALIQAVQRCVRCAAAPRGAIGAICV